MPFFFDKYLHENWTEFLSVFAAFCENFQIPKKMVNLKIPHTNQAIILKKIIFLFKKKKYLKNSYKQQKAYFFLIFECEEKKKFALKEFFGVFQKQIKEFENKLGFKSFSLNKEVYLRKSSFALNVSKTNELSKQTVQVESVEYSLEFFLGKSNPFGVSYSQIDHFVYRGKVQGIKGKGIFSSFLLAFLEKRGFLEIKKWKCWKSLFGEKRFVVKKNVPGEKKNLRFPPCMGCPVHYECHPQGIINPFDCVFFFYWEKDFEIQTKLKNRNKK